MQLVQLFLSDESNPISTPDSGTYRFPDAQWLDLRAIFEGKRPLLITGWYALFPSDELRVISQTLLYTVAWSFLIIATSKLYHNRLVGQVATASVWLLGFSTLVAQWNVLVLSESLTISLLAAALAALFIWIANGQTRFVQAFAVLLIAAALIRPQLFIVVVLVAVTWLIFGRRTKLTRTGYLATSVILVGGVILSIGQQFWNDRNFSTDQLVGRTTWIYTNALLPSSPFAERIVQALPSTAPDCIVPSEPLGDTAGQFLIEAYRANCPEGLLWIQENFQGVYWRFLVSDPVATVADTARLMWDSAAMYVYGTTYSLGPTKQLTSLFALDDSRYLVTTFVIAFATVLIGWSSFATWNRNVVTILFALITFFGVSWVGALLLQIADLHRTSVTSIVPINILLLALFFFAIDGIVKQARVKF